MVGKLSEVVKKFRFGASRERQRPEFCKVLRSLTLPARLILRKLSEEVPPGTTLKR